MDISHAHLFSLGGVPGFLEPFGLESPPAVLEQHVADLKYLEQS